MTIPRYWKRATRDITSPDGKSLKIASWGWSQFSEDEARNFAESRLQELASRILLSKQNLVEYPYPRTPLREEIIQELDSRDQEFDVITRNGYGATVLNTTSVYFADIDIKPNSLGSIFSTIGRIFGIKPTETEKISGVDDALARLDKYLSLNRSWGFRVYKTFAGLRYLATHARIPITESGISESLTSLGSDPKYIRLCQIQKCYRARLSPKPWRCGLYAPQVRFPFETLAAEKNFRIWKLKYDEAEKKYATCQFIKSVGYADINSDVAKIVSLHDESTRALSGLPLA